MLQLLASVVEETSHAVGSNESSIVIIRFFDVNLTDELFTPFSMCLLVPRCQVVYTRNTNTTVTTFWLLVNRFRNSSNKPVTKSTSLKDA